MILSRIARQKDCSKVIACGVCVNHVWLHVRRIVDVLIERPSRHLVTPSSGVGQSGVVRTVCWAVGAVCFCDGQTWGWDKVVSLWKQDQCLSLLSSCHCMCYWLIGFFCCRHVFLLLCVHIVHFSSVLWHCLLCHRKDVRPVKTCASLSCSQRKSSIEGQLNKKLK